MKKNPKLVEEVWATAWVGLEGQAGGQNCTEQWSEPLVDELFDGEPLEGFEKM